MCTPFTEPVQWQGEPGAVCDQNTIDARTFYGVSVNEFSFK